MTHHGTPLSDGHGPSATCRATATWRACCGAAGAGTTASRRMPSRRSSGSASTRRATRRSRPATRRNDVLARATDADAERIRRELGIEAGKTAVLYAPTHREYEADPHAAAGSRAVRRWPRARSRRDGAPATTSTTRHPLLRELHDAGRIRDVAAHPSVEELCIAADVLVTTTRPSCSTSPCSTARSSSTLPTGDLPRAPGHVLRPHDRGAGPGRAHRCRAARRGAVGPAGRRGARRVPRSFCSLEDGGAAERVVRWRCSR